MRLCKIIYCLVLINIALGSLLWIEPRALSETSDQMDEVARDIFQFIWSRDQISKIENEESGGRQPGGVATFGESRLVLGRTTIWCRILTLTFAPDDAVDGAKVLGPSGVDTRTVWKAEGRGGVIIRHRDEDQVATGQIITIDFRKSTAILNNGVVLTRGSNILKGDRLLMDLRTGASRLERRKYRKVTGEYD